jgi:hypothetical protein
MSAISGFMEAPPTRNPSMSGHAASSGALAAVAEPPYWMRICRGKEETKKAVVKSGERKGTLMGETKHARNKTHILHGLIRAKEKKSDKGNWDTSKSPIEASSHELLQYIKFLQESFEEIWMAH